MRQGFAKSPPRSGSGQGPCEAPRAAETIRQLQDGPRRAVQPLGRAECRERRCGTRLAYLGRIACASCHKCVEQRPLAPERASMALQAPFLWFEKKKDNGTLSLPSPRLDRRPNLPFRRRSLPFDRPHDPWERGDGRPHVPQREDQVFQKRRLDLPWSRADGRPYLLYGRLDLPSDPSKGRLSWADFGLYSSFVS